MATRRKTNTPELQLEESSDSVARRTFVALAVATGFVAGLWILYSVRHILVLLLVALIIALALAPMVRWLQRRGLHRGVASGLAVVVVVLGIAGLISAVTPTFITESDRLGRDLPRLVNEAGSKEPLKGLNERFDLNDRAREAADSLPVIFTGPNGTIIDAVRNTLNAILTVVVILALTFFMLLEGPSSWRKSLKLLKPRYRYRLTRVGNKVGDAVGGFVWGNLLISLVAGTVALLTMLVFGVPYALPVAVVVGVLALIPLVGSTIATLLLTLIALSQGVGTALGVLVVYGAYQIIESNVVVPMIFARALKLSPLVVLIATITGGTIGGIVGVLLAIPAAAAIQIVIIELLGTATAKRATSG